MPAAAHVPHRQHHWLFTGIRPAILALKSNLLIERGYGTLHGVTMEALEPRMLRQ